MTSILENVAKSLGIDSKELFSGKYGDSYDEILTKLLELKSKQK